MAELRWEVMQDTVNDGTAVANAGAEFRNETSAMIHIRRIRAACLLSAAAPGEASTIELSKAPVFQSNTDESPFFTYPVQLAIPATGATPADGDAAENEESLYGRGHLTLEPNESLFLNTNKTAGGQSVGRFVLGYEF